MDYTGIIDQWPSTQDLATDLGLKPDTVRKWRERNSIPAAWWANIENAAIERKLPVDINLLAQIARNKQPLSSSINQ